MADSTKKSQAESQYRIDVENAAEMARLTKQGRLVIELLGLFPEQMTLSPGSRVLDIGSGPGEWALDVARAAPECQVTGIDISNLMVDYAQSCAQSQNLANVSFQVMDARRPLAFSDATFDFVHLSAAMSFLSPTNWPQVLQECFRVMSPEGVICSKESEGMGVILTPALARYNVLLMQAFRQVGQCFAPEGPEFGITAAQRQLLMQAGFTEVKSQATVLDYSAGTAAHSLWYENYRSMIKLTQPFLLKNGMSTPQEIEQLSEQALEEMRRDDFCAIVVIQTVWGKKPLPAC